MYIGYSKVRTRDLLKKTLILFLEDNNTSHLVIIIIFLSILIVKKTELEINIFQNMYSQSNSKQEMLKIVFKIFIYEVFSSFLIEMKGYIFAGAYGNHFKKISALAFKNILQTKKIIENENGILQNEINIGSSGMAELLSITVLNILPQIIGILVLLDKFKDEFGSVFCILVLFSFVLCAFLHLYVVFLKIKYQKIMNDYGGQGQKIVYETLINAEIIKANGCEDYEAKRYENKLFIQQKGAVSFKRKRNILTFFHRFLFSTLKIVVNSYYIIMHGDDQLITKLAILKSLLYLSEINATRSGDIYLKIKKNCTNASLIYKNLESKHKVTKKEKIQNFTSLIKIKNLGISYNEKTIIKNLNFEIKKGDRIAIIGNNGMGKSSFLKALIRLVNYEGKIIIDEKDIKNYDLNSYKDLFSYLSQNITLFDNTIYYNIIYGSKNKNLQDVIDICDELNLTPCIKKFEMGFYTKVGENGNLLSGGMRQKILLARILLKKSSLLLLDEPTSNLDENTKKKFTDIIFNGNKNITVLIITHQIYGLHKFDKFFYFNEGDYIVFNNYLEIVNFLEEKNNIKIEND